MTSKRRQRGEGSVSEDTLRYTTKGESVTLTEFLLARIAEDEAVSERWPDDDPTLGADGELWVDTMGHPIWAPKARLLAECEAKRRIVEAFLDAERAGASGNQHYELVDTTPAVWQEWGYRHGLAEAVEYLAAAYAHHPHYDEAWRP